MKVNFKILVEISASGSPGLKKVSLTKTLPDCKKISILGNYRCMKTFLKINPLMAENKFYFSNKNGPNNFDPFVSEIANRTLQKTGLITSL